MVKVKIDLLYNYLSVDSVIFGDQNRKDLFEVALIQVRLQGAQKVIVIPPCHIELVENKRQGFTPFVFQALGAATSFIIHIFTCKI